MSLISVLADLSGLTAELREIRLVMSRVADALDRIAPAPLPLPSTSGSDSPDLPDLPSYGIAESPEEYQARTSAEASLAVSLGFAPWSPAFQEIITQFRADLMKSKLVLNEEGQQVETPGLSEDEAHAIIREAFGIAKAEANVR